MVSIKGEINKKSYKTSDIFTIIGLISSRNNVIFRTSQREYVHGMVEKVEICWIMGMGWRAIPGMQFKVMVQH